MNPIVQEVTRNHLKTQIPDFRAGDTVRVGIRIVEGDKERVQQFEGVVIARNGAGMDETFTVRRVSFGVGMERIFPTHSPRVETIKVVRQGRVRRGKLYYLRNRSGKKARLAETRRKRLGRDTMLETQIPEELVIEEEAVIVEDEQVEAEEAAAEENEAEEAAETEASAETEDSAADAQEEASESEAETTEDSGDDAGEASDDAEDKKS